MTKVAVLGANGQVGAEVCLLLSQQRGLEVVPVCRNRLGSAYLRYRGLACRHGQPAEPSDAKALFGDCDVIVNLALVASLADPRGARATNAKLIENVATCSQPGARHIYFSTMSVYGDRHQNQRIAWRNSYAQDKWRTEKLVRAWTRRTNGTACIFRLGHVCGELQGITQQIRQALCAGQPIPVADPERASNTVYVATIVDAILRVAAGRVPVGTYDLMNVPQWTWREVFVHEGRAFGVVPTFCVVGDPPRAGLAGFIKRILANLLGDIAAAPQTRRILGRLVPYVPRGLYRKIRAQYAVRSARSHIQGLHKQAGPMDAVLRTPVGECNCPGLSPTVSLLSSPDLQLRPAAAAGVWPADLPLATRTLLNRAESSHDTTGTASAVVSDANA